MFLKSIQTSSWTGKKQAPNRGRYKKQIKSEVEIEAASDALTKASEPVGKGEDKNEAPSPSSESNETDNIDEKEQFEQNREKEQACEEELQKRKGIQLKILNFLKMWIENVPETFVDTINYLSLQNLFQKMKMDEKNATPVSHLQETLENMLKKYFTKVESSKIAINYKNGTENIDGATLLDIDYVILAQQLTLIDFDIFSKITTLEILQKNWSAACWIVALSNRFNDLSSWFTWQILQIQLEKRKSVLSYLIKLLDCLFKMKNYFSSMCLLSVLESTPVSRLSRTWEVCTALLMHTQNYLPNIIFSYRK